MATGGYGKPKGKVDRRCHSCQQAGEENDAEYYCEVCQEYLCNDCKEAHRKVSLTRGHEVTKVKAVSDTPPEMITSDDVHECEPCKTDGYEKKAIYYCGICQEYLCGSCGNNHEKFKVLKDHVLTKLHVPTPMSQTVPSENNQDVILDLSPQSISKVNVTVANDKNVPRIRGCTFLSNGELLLCDCNNKNIKLLDKSLTVSDSIELDCSPWDVAVVNNKTAIVTLPLEKQLQYVDLVPNLSIGSKMSTKQKCWGIVVVNELIYITCHGGIDNPEKAGDICVLDLRGNELKKIGINRNGSQFLRLPYYIAVNREGNKLYVTDYTTHEIICISPSGNVIYKLKDSDIYGPYGVYVDSQDNLVVCSKRNDTVQVIAANGTRYKTLLVSNDGVREPIGIAFRPTDSTLIVGLKESNEVLAVKLA